MIIIPDIHGRTFWKEAIQGHEEEDIVFLGDYLDPYSYEGITPYDALVNFREILQFKNSHPDNVTLLLGNHDLGYLSSEINMCRRDFAHQDEIRQLLTDNAACFQLCTSREIAGKTYLFSHSFLSRHWLEICKECLQFDYSQPSEIAGILNTLFRDEQPKMLVLLAVASHYRGGDHAFGSMVWSDVMEVSLEGAFIDGIVNIFGHTQIKSPLIYKHFACLDFKHAFELKDDGTIDMMH